MAFAIMVRQTDSVMVLDLAGHLVLGQPIEHLRDTITRRRLPSWHRIPEPPLTPSCWCSRSQ